MVTGFRIDRVRVQLQERLESARPLNSLERDLKVSLKELLACFKKEYAE